MSDSNVKTTTITNFLWRFAERVGAQGVTFIVTIVLARLVTPNDYGTVALITVILDILQVFVDSGLGNALIQKKEADDLDFSSVFYFNLLVGAVLYAGMFFFAPAIASFYGNPALIALIRFVSIRVLISAVKNVQQAYVSRQLIFRKFFYATIGGTLISAVIGIWMAYKGFGAWAIGVQNISNMALDTLILWIVVKWRPKRMFSLERLKTLFSYGWKLLVSAVMDTTYNNLYQLVIGKVYTPSELAYYNKGNQFPSFIIGNIDVSIDSVLLPTMSKEQDDVARVRSMTRRAIKTSTYLMAPMMMGILAIATPLVRLLLTEKWLPCVDFLRIFCIIYMFYPVHTTNLNAIKAMGRSDLFLKLEVIKKVMGVVMLIITIPMGIMPMLYGRLINSVLSQVINSWPNKKLIRYSYPEQLKDILPGILTAALMGAGVFLITLLPVSDLLRVLLGIGFGVLFYWGVSEIFHIEEYMYLKKIALDFLRKRKKG
ncbi:MAG: lipopolysaccharide biosynthesis protein [Eubacterium sp.]|nr:lipopolysaccharide biosynthesis protein [Eubacterium sp.]